MIQLYSWATPNGHKVQIMLEECGLGYKLVPVDITKGDQFSPEFQEISPNGRIPAIVDDDGPDGRLALFESGAILLYLAEKTGRFLPHETTRRWQTIQWLMWQMGGLGPMFGQAQHFHRYAPVDVPYARERYVREGRRLAEVLEEQLAKTRFLGGDEYSIADISAFPWIRIHKLTGVEVQDLPNVQRWYGDIRSRPAVERGLNVLRSEWVDVSKSDDAKRALFGEMNEFGER